jgi:predicted kinase
VDGLAAHAVRLVLLNGPPGIGKTTIARRYVADRPLALCLDVDTIRRGLGQWQALPTESGLAARAMAMAMARVHLTEGHDVVVPQFLARAEFADRLAAVAAETGATFHEVVLMDTRANALARFAARAGDPDLAAHHAEAAATAGGAAGLAEMYDRLVAMLATRPDAVVIASRAGEVDATYAALLETLGER